LDGGGDAAPAGRRRRGRCDAALAAQGSGGVACGAGGGVV
jgi:hypothetical protein